MGSLSIWHWLIVLVIIMLVFGTKKLRNIGSDLGGAVRGFKEGVKEGTDKKLRVYAGPNHPHSAQQPQPRDIPSKRAAADA